MTRLWGRLPDLSILIAGGLLVTAEGDTLARQASPWGSVLFWIGLLMMYIPVTVRLLKPNLMRREQVGLLVLLGLALYAVKLMHSPLDFTFADEFAHWRTVSDILQSGHLFQKNPLLPVAHLYPGLASATDALVNLGRLSIFDAGVVLLAAARIVMVLALYLFYKQASRSARIAGLAVLLYMANPNFVFFDAQFAYESLAIPITMLALYLLARRANQNKSDLTTSTHFALTVVVLLALFAVTITHHMTSYALTAFLIGWLICGWLWRGVQRISRRNIRYPVDYVLRGSTPLLMSVLVLSWLTYAASLTLAYLAPNVSGGFQQLIQLIAGEASGRQLFRGQTGQSAVLLEQLTGICSVMLILMGLPIGMWRLWQQRRANALVCILAVSALAYPASLALRLTQNGAETANRASEFVFLPLAFVVAGALDLFMTEPRLRTLWLKPLIVACCGIIFAGGVIIGFAPWSRLPGVYIVAADTRSVEMEGIDAARWANVALGAGNRIAADRTNRLLMGAYGEQYTVTAYGDNIPVAALYLSAGIGQDERTLLQKGLIRDVVVDRRLNTALPLLGVYFEQGEPGAFAHNTPPSAQVLAKFDGLQGAGIHGISRIFDSGNIQIYDVRDFTNVP